jgi:hypothetical protein
MTHKALSRKTPAARRRWRSGRSSNASGRSDRATSTVRRPTNGQMQPREPALLIEHLGATREEEVERILTPGYVPDVPSDGVQAIPTGSHLRITQTLQEISLHLHRQSFMV